MEFKGVIIVESDDIDLLRIFVDECEILKGNKKGYEDLEFTYCEEK